MATLPPGGALIAHQVALLEGKKGQISAVCGLIGLKLWWMVMVGHGYIASLPPGGTLIIHHVALIGGKKGSISAVCGMIWLKLRWMVGVGHGHLATRWRPNQPPGGH